MFIFICRYVFGFRFDFPYNCLWLRLLLLVRKEKDKGREEEGREEKMEELFYRDSVSIYQQQHMTVLLPRRLTATAAPFFCIHNQFIILSFISIIFNNIPFVKLKFHGVSIDFL